MGPAEVHQAGAACMGGWGCLSVEQVGKAACPSSDAASNAMVLSEILLCP